MHRPADLLASLHAADEHLATLTPGAHLEARLRARLRGERPSSRGPFGGVGLRLRRPLVLAFAVAAGAMIFVQDRPPSAAQGAAVAGAPSAPPELTPERIAVDGAKPDPTLSPRQVRTPRVIHAPTREPIPTHRVGDPPLAPRLALPPSALRGTPLLAPGLFDSIDNLPAPLERLREGLVPAVRSESKVFGALPSPKPPGTATATPAYSRPPQTDHSLTPPPASVDPSSEAPSAGCRSADELSEEGYLRCKQKDLSLVEVTYLSSCGDGRYRGVEVQCTEESKAKPEPSTCKSGQFGDGITCQGYGPFKDQAYTDCLKAGLVLVDMQVVSTDGCSADEITMGTYTCCTSQDPPGSPPPASSPPASSPPNKCTYSVLGDAITCQDTGTFEQAAAQVCNSAGATLVTIKVSGDCQGGQSTLAHYECCSAPTNP